MKIRKRNKDKHLLKPQKAHSCGDLALCHLTSSLANVVKEAGRHTKSLVLYSTFSAWDSIYSCNTGMDKYTKSLRAAVIHIRQITSAHVTAIYSMAVKKVQPCSKIASVKKFVKSKGQPRNGCDDIG